MPSFKGSAIKKILACGIMRAKMANERSNKTIKNGAAIVTSPAPIGIKTFCQCLIKKKNISLTIDSGVVELKSDFVLLKEIITELLDNALEFGNPQQGIELHFKDSAIIRVISYGFKFRNRFTQKMYYPSFSNKARGVGLALSKCVRYARKLGYKTELSENSNVNGISFDILMK